MSEQLHHQKVRAVLVPDVVQRADVRMGERGHGARLAIEPFPQIRIAMEMGRQHLHGHQAIEPGIAPAIDLAHASRAYGTEDFVGSQTRTGSKRHAGLVPPAVETCRCVGNSDLLPSFFVVQDATRAPAGTLKQILTQLADAG